MRVAFCYPPYKKGEKNAFLPQNRQFIYSSSSEVRLYPVVMATAATMLRKAGQTVFWLDGITEGLTLSEFWRRLLDFQPDLVVTETKAPVVEKTWDFINKLKTQNPKLKTILVGDNVTYFPEESLKKSKVDFVLTGGDYDFLIANLVEHLEKKKKLEPGIWYRKEIRNKKYDIRNTGKFRLDHDLDATPIIDRDLTRFWLYGEADVLNPCAYMMFGRGCGGIRGKPGSCTFCIWQHCLWVLKPRLRSPEHVIAEIKYLLKKYQVREIFDDTDGGAHYDYQWLKKFYRLLKEEKILGQVSFSTNSRADILDKKTCELLKKCGFRMLKVGVEAGTNETLKRIAKGETISQIRKGIQNAKDAGLIVHLSAMVGYPWETEEDAQQTFELMRELLLYKTRVGDSVQASVIVPYPGTPLWQEAKKNKWFVIKPTEYEKYDMSQPVLKSKIDTTFWCKKIWNLHLNPVFLVKTGLAIRSGEDIKFLIRGAASHFGHTKDYG
jgi:radical SAM superfamily enzyme YgiQ (UPF0313 family)